DLAISEPSRIVKLDAILAAGVGHGRPSNQTGGVFKLPGVQGDGSDKAAAVIATAAAAETGTGPLKVGTGTGPARAVGPFATGTGSYPSVMEPLPSRHDHHLYKLFAIAGGVATLVLVVVVLFLLQRTGATRTIIIEKEKSPEDIGAEFAEQIAREEASKKFGPVAKAEKDSIT